MYPPLFPYESDILLWINSHHSTFLDAFMYMISNPGAWLPLIIVLVYYIFANKPWQEGVLLILSLGVCLLLGHLLSNLWAKPFFERFRPTHAPEYKELIHVVYNYVGSPYGFFSGHACNFFGIATVLSLTIRHTKCIILIYLIVLLVVYSRLYLGVHFLSDVLVGATVGSILGYSCHTLKEYLRRYYSPLSRKKTYEIYSPLNNILSLSLIGFLLILISYSFEIANIIQQYHLSNI